MFKLLSTIVRWMAHLARKRTKKNKTTKKTKRDCIVQATESRTKAYGPGRRGGGGGGCGGTAPNFSKIWNFPGKKLMTRKTVVEVKNSNNNKNNDNNNNTNDCHSQTSGYMDTSQIQACSVNRWRELVDYAPIPLNRRGGGGGWGWRKVGYVVGIWHFSKILPSNSCPRANHSSQLQPNFPTTDAHCCQICQGWTQEMHNKNISR